MSKRKSRKQRRRQRAGPPAGTTTGGAVEQRYSQRDAIPTDYSHVIKDLRRIALYGGLLLAALVVLSFLIR